MNTLKLFVGYGLLAVAAVLTMALLVTVVRSVPEIASKMAEDSAYGGGFLVGSLIGYAFVGFVIYFLTRQGLKLVKRSRQNTSL